MPPLGPAGTILMAATVRGQHHGDICLDGTDRLDIPRRTFAAFSVWWFRIRLVPKI
jgi:hypothetical protein